MDVSIELSEWTKIYLKSKDAMQKAIVSFEAAGVDFIVHKTTGDVVFLIRPEFTDAAEIVEKCQGQCGLVVLNTKKNLDVVIANWAKLAALKGLCIYFVNPMVNEKWLLYPYTHDQITEKPALKRGLESLFMMVPPYA